jgi:hypothetical protein
MAWALTGGLGVVFLALGVMAVLGLRSGDQDSAGETERAMEFGERPGDDETFVDAELTVHRVLPEETTAGWRLGQHQAVRHA